MRREQFDVGRYYRLSPQERINSIIRNYGCYQGIIDDYRRELYDWIDGNREKARRDAIGDLGVRICSGAAFVSSTENAVNAKWEIDGILDTYKLTPSCEGIEDYDEISRGLLELKLMKREYRRFRERLASLRSEERKIFLLYMKSSNEGPAVCEEVGLSYKTYRNRVCLIKKKIFSGFICRLDTYDDMNIYIVGGLSDE